MNALLVAAAIGVLLAPARADARVWTVGRGATDFPLIAPAVATAADGDEIRIGAGVYREDIVLNKRLTLIGVGRPIIFGTGNGTVIDVVADHCTIRNLVIDGTGIGAGNQMDAAIRLSSNHNIVSHNIMRRVFYGVVIAGGSENLVDANEIEGLLHLPYGRRGDGIYVYRGPRNHIVGNRVVGQRDAIFLQYANDVRVERNVVEQSRYGLHDMFSDDTVVRGNTFRASLVGANLMNSRRLALDGNHFTGNRGAAAVGLSLKDCDASIVSNNLFTGNVRALQLDGASGNAFLSNRFAQNDVAVRVLASAERNTFSTNEFLQNWSDVVESGGDSTNKWSRNGVGNRWSRYNGFDFDADGIGETAHTLVRPFERIEAANDLARLYLQSPAAGALDLAARSAASSRRASTDEFPLTARAQESGRERPHVWVFAPLLLLCLPVVRRVRRHA
jgi:nitrous oxidase accessory protein